MASILSRHKNAKPQKKTMSDHAEDALYREVWEDVNNDKTMAFLKKYYRVIIAAALVLLVIVVGAQAWRHHVRTSRIATAQNYEIAIDTMDERALFAMGAKSSGATADLAVFQSYMLNGDESKLDALAQNGNTRDFRDLATIHLAGIRGDTMSATEFEKFMSPLNTKKSPYYFNALLLVAQKYLATGDRATANIWLDKIITDKDAPSIVAASAENLR